jgi:hypothetical protein
MEIIMKLLVLLGLLISLFCLFHKQYQQLILILWSIKNGKKLKNMLDAQIQVHPNITGNEYYKMFISTAHPEATLNVEKSRKHFWIPGLLIIIAFNMLVTVALNCYVPSDQIVAIILKWINICIVSLIFLNILSKLILLVLYRCFLSTYDYLAYCTPSQVKQLSTIIDISKEIVITNFLKVFTVLFVTIVVGYGRIYYELLIHKGLGGDFSNINVWEKIIKCTYYSISSLSTVGFGDVYAKSWLTQIICSSEIFFGFVLLAGC